MAPQKRTGTPPNALVSTALVKTVSSLPRTDQDAAVIQLARRYAAAIDENPSATVLEKIGPKLLAALIELGATPAARKTKQTGPADVVDPTRAAMDELRARRAAR